MNLEALTEEEHDGLGGAMNAAPLPEDQHSYFTDSLLVGRHRDHFFQGLAAINVCINYAQLTKGRPAYHEGRERHSLFTASLYVECLSLEPKVVSNPVDDSERVELTKDLSIREVIAKLLHDGEGDGAYIVYRSDEKPGKYKVSTKRHLMARHRSDVVRTIREDRPEESVKGIHDVFRLYLPSDFVHFSDIKLDVDHIGSRTETALNVPIYLGGGKVYSLKQTVYNNGGVGKVCLFTRDGLSAEFFLGKADELESPRRRIATSNYVDPAEGVVAILRTYHPANKGDRREYVIQPEALQLPRIALPSRYTHPR